MVNPKSWGSCPMFSSKNFIDLGLTFKSYIHFELNFGYGVTHMKGPTSFFFFAHAYPVFPAPFVEKTVFSPLNGLGTLVKNPLPLYAKVCFQTSCSIPLIYMYLYASTMMLPNCMCKFWNREVFQLCSSFSELFDFSGSLEISYKF